MADFHRIMKKPKYPIGILIIFIPFVLTLLISYIYLGFISNLKRCTWCNKPMGEEGTQLREYWLHDYCFSKLNSCAGEIWGREYSKDRMEWIYNLVDKKVKWRKEK